MAFDLKNMNFQTRKVVKECQFAVGGVIPIAPEKPLKKVISVVPTCLLVGNESVDYNHNMRGKINIEMLYLTEENEYVTTKAEFSFEHTENVVAENVGYKVEIAEYSVTEETQTYVKLNFLTCAYLYGTIVDNLSALDGTEDNYVVAEGSFEHVSYLQGAKSQTELEDKIELDGATNVLGYEAVVKTNSASCGIDQISAGGEVTLKLCCLTENGIVNVERQLEYNYEVACLGVNPDDFAKTCVEVSKVDYAFVDGEKATINVKLTLEIDASAYRKQTEKIIDDLFSTTKEIEAVTACANFADYLGQKTLQEEVSYCEKLQDDQELLFAKVDSTNIAKLLAGDGRFTAEGVVAISLATTNQAGEVFTQTLGVPFAVQKQTEQDGEASEYHVQAMIKSVAKRENELEVNLLLLFEIAYEKERYVQYVSSVKEVGEKEGPASAITIYVAGDGDTLFSVAKALSVEPEKIQSQNQLVDGKFEKGQRIFVYNPLVAEF